MKKLICVFLLICVLTTGVFAKESSINLSTFNLTTKSNVTARQLDEILKYNLKGLGEYFVKAEQEHEVNALFLASLSALESGWGRYCFRENNIFGYSGVSFSSKAECIDFVAQKLKQNYLSKDGKYHTGYTISDVNRYYNGSDFWEETVTDIMSSFIRKLN